MTTKQTNQRTFRGQVASAKGDKTLVVVVDSTKRHPKYQKQYKVSKRFLVHDEKNQFKAGDVVTFIECRPMSKKKRWRVLYR